MATECPKCQGSMVFSKILMNRQKDKIIGAVAVCTSCHDTRVTKSDQAKQWAIRNAGRRDVTYEH